MNSDGCNSVLIFPENHFNMNKLIGKKTIQAVGRILVVIRRYTVVHYGTQAVKQLKLIIK